MKRIIRQHMMPGNIECDYCRNMKASSKYILTDEKEEKESWICDSCVGLFIEGGWTYLESWSQQGGE